MRRSPANTRRGMSLMEVMVVLAILLLIMAVLVPSLSSFLQLRQRKAGTQLVMLYEQLHDEAVLYNATFRVVYDLHGNQYKVEVGETRAVIYSSPEQRERYEREIREKLALMDEEELAEWRREHKPFQNLQTKFKSDFTMPPGTVIRAVYTPQYGKMMTRDDIDLDDEEASTMVFSYVFANGFSEHTLVWITDEDDEDDGYTIEIEPLSGRVVIHPELISFEDSFEWVPDEGPDLPS